MQCNACRHAPPVQLRVGSLPSPPTPHRPKHWIRRRGGKTFHTKYFSRLPRAHPRSRASLQWCTPRYFLRPCHLLICGLAVSATRRALFPPNPAQSPSNPTHIDAGVRGVLAVGLSIVRGVPISRTGIETVGSATDIDSNRNVKATANQGSRGIRCCICSGRPEATVAVGRAVSTKN
jgi:hypothetical protein